MSKKKRLKYIDVVKGFSILLIVLGHILIEYNPTSKFVIWIYSFHVPIFFILVGWISYRKEYNKNQFKSIVEKDAKSLLYPYFTFSIVFIIWDIFEYLFFNNSVKLIFKDLMLMISLYGIKTLWFLTCLFIAKTIYSFQKCKLDKKKIYVSNIIIIAIIYLMTQYVKIFQAKNGIYFYIEKIIQLIIRPLIALIYIYIGSFIHKKIKDEKINWLWIIMFFLLNILFGQLNGRVDLYSLRINNIFLYFLSATLGSLSVILFFKKIINIKIFEFFGRNSLIVMATHQKFPFIVVFKNLFEQRNLNSNISVVCIFLIMILIESLLIYIINKYAIILLRLERKNEGSSKVE